MIFIGDNGLATEATFLKLPDPGGSENSELLIQSTGTSGLEFLKGDATVDPFGAAVGAANPYPVETPGYLDCDYGYDGEPTDPCDMEGYDDPDNEAGENGSVPKATCYVNGVEQHCHDAFHQVATDAGYVDWSLTSQSAAGEFSVFRNLYEKEDGGQTDGLVDLDVDVPFEPQTPVPFDLPGIKRRRGKNMGRSGV